MENPFREIKAGLETKIPSYDSADFKKLRDKIIKKLKIEENALLVSIRSLKILVLGDWYSDGKKKLLTDIRNMLIENRLYAETIDRYYDMSNKSGLSQEQILEICCVRHQLIVFIDGDGKGTITEQNYLSNNYIFHGKLIFFIEESKFDSLKSSPNEYVKDFPTIIPYKSHQLLEKVLIYSRFRLYRLANIIRRQRANGRGINNPRYQPWKHRLRKRHKST